jgi:hypothetical protein
MTLDQLLRTISEPANRDFIAAWQRWRGERPLPRRSDLRLEEIKPLLGMIALFEPRAPGHIHVRVAGTGLRQYLGFEMTGMNYLEVTAAADRAVREYRVRQMTGQPSGGVLRYRLAVSDGRQFAAEVVSLPLDPDRPGQPRLLLSHTATMALQREPLVDAATGAVRLPDEFGFVDLGFGLPAG